MRVGNGLKTRTRPALHKVHVKGGTNEHETRGQYTRARSSTETRDSYRRIHTRLWRTIPWVSKENARIRSVLMGRCRTGKIYRLPVNVAVNPTARDRYSKFRARCTRGRFVNCFAKMSEMYEREKERESIVLYY